MNNDKINSLYQKFIADGYNISLRECMGGYPNKIDCAWYHGNWMLFRYLGVVSNPYWHEKFYYEALKKICDLKKDSVLIAGTADFSMPLLCSEVGVNNINICDICNTPLKICNRVSEYLNLNWNTFTHGICSELTLKYNVIINDAFLSRFQNKEMPLRGITNTLISGGYYITTLKMGKMNRGGEIEDSVKRRFVEKVERRYNEHLDVLPKVPIKDIANEYVEKMSSFPVSGEKEVQELFEAVGLKILYLEKDTVEGEYDISEYFRIISQK